MSDSTRRTTSGSLNRREFVKTAAAGAAVALGAPAIVTASKTGSQVIIGEGDYRYEANHNWPQLPSQFTWQTTHNVAIDKDGFVYIVHEGRADQPDHPSIFVFDPEGKYVRSFGKQFQGGGHGLEVRTEGNQQYLYVTGYQALKMFQKMDLNGEVVWTKYAPMESGVYAENEDTKRAKEWGRNRFMPTNYAFPPDGGFILADGYGAWYIHRYDEAGNWRSCFGGEGKEDGKFNTPHGVWIDNRPGRDPSIVVADRANGRLQWFTLDGQHQRTQDGFFLPANIDVHGELMLVPDLQARVTLLGRDNQIVAQLGEDPEWRTEVMKMNVRKDPSTWRDGKFAHPHDACFDKDGNIFVVEWVDTGRITKLTRLT